MKHFWLNEDQQALMDSATSTAADYGYIGLFSVGKAWKRHVEGMVGSKVDPKDYLRAYNVTGQTQFAGPGSYWNGEKVKEVRAAIRLNKRQAMMMKLRHGGSDVAWLRDDPTGECWGNMLNCQAARKSDWRPQEVFRYGFRLMLSYLNDGNFGPTIASVGTHADGLEEDWRAAFVRYHFTQWDEANKPIADKPGSVQEAMARLRLGPPAWETEESSWVAPATLQGTRWAQEFWRDCQNTEVRRRLLSW